MDDLISRQAAIVRACNAIKDDSAAFDVKEALKAVPTAEKKGKWTLGEDMPPMKHRNGKPKKFWPSLKYCSCCGHEAFDDSDWGEQLFDWCPYCGAKMEE